MARIINTWKKGLSLFLVVADICYPYRLFFMINQVFFYLEKGLFRIYNITIRASFGLLILVFIL